MKSFLFALLLPIISLCANPKNWIVVTTINPPSEALIKLSQLPEWQLLVIGDKKTPASWQLDNCIYLGPEEQNGLPYELVRLLPWNHYARKNIGYLYAIDHGASHIYETDDDNYVINGIHPIQEDPVTLSTDQIVLNVYAYFGRADIWPRGYPLSYIQSNAPFTLSKQPHHKIVIEQGLVNQEPDVDAIFRLTQQGSDAITFDDTVAPCILAPGIYCPFNTQNTLFHEEAFWALYLPSFISLRVSDIWKGYIAQRLLQEADGALCFTPPSAIQERNPHNLLKDFADEQILYLQTEKFLEFLSCWEAPLNASILEKLQALYRACIQQGFIAPQEEELVNAWISDLQLIGEKKSIKGTHAN